MVDREDMIHVRSAFELIGALPLHNFPQAAGAVKLAVMFLNMGYSQIGMAPLSLDLSAVEAIAAGEGDAAALDAAWEIVGRLRPSSYADTLAILSNVVHYLVNDIRLKWNAAGLTPPRANLRLVEGGFCAPTDACKAAS